MDIIGMTASGEDGGFSVASADYIISYQQARRNTTVCAIITMQKNSKFPLTNYPVWGIIMSRSTERPLPQHPDRERR